MDLTWVCSIWTFIPGQVSEVEPGAVVFAISTKSMSSAALVMTASTRISEVQRGQTRGLSLFAAQTAAARLGVAVNGPPTLTAGMSGTYNVSVSNSGDVSAPVELFISFNGKLQQTGQPGSSGGFDCTVNNYSGGTSSVHCTVGQFGSKATANITVQGQGSAPGAGQVVVNINSSDPAAQFVQKSQQLNVTIT